MTKTNGVNQEWIIQRHWQHWAHKTQGDHKQSTTQHIIKTKNGTHQKPGVLPKGKKFLLLRSVFYFIFFLIPIKVLAQALEKGQLSILQTSVLSCSLLVEMKKI